LSPAVITCPTFPSEKDIETPHPLTIGKADSLKIMVNQASNGDNCGVLTVRENQDVDELIEETRVIGPSLFGTESDHKHSEERDARGKVSSRLSNPSFLRSLTSKP
jgi:hypothetical protein